MKLNREMQKDGYYMLDSSYLHPCDPNSMRNFGPPRNATYNIKYGHDDGDLQSEDKWEKTQSTWETYDYKAVRPNDYTKNISEAIFSPGVGVGKLKYHKTLKMNSIAPRAKSEIKS
jgi:hypothetical protein